MTIQQIVHGLLINRGIKFFPTYDSSVWLEFTLDDSDDVFHVMDGYNFGSTAIDAADRFILDLNIDPDDESDMAPHLVAPNLIQLLANV